MKKFLYQALLCFLFFTGCSLTANVDVSTTINHDSALPGLVPESAILLAKSSLRIAYGHTSHGSQITTGMTALAAWKGTLYNYNSGGTGGALDLRDTPFSGASDLGAVSNIILIPQKSKRAYSKKA